MESQNKLLERHVQTILVSLITAGILWVGITVSSLQTNVAVVQASLARLESKFSTVDVDHIKLLELIERVKALEARKK